LVWIVMSATLSPFTSPATKKLPPELYALSWPAVPLNAPAPMKAKASSAPPETASIAARSTFSGPCAKSRMRSLPPISPKAKLVGAVAAAEHVVAGAAVEQVGAVCRRSACRRRHRR
jgi:hypothetical protein